MTLRLIAIGGLGNMLAPSAKHLKDSDIVKFSRVLDRGSLGTNREERRQAWRDYGAALVPTLQELVGAGDFDGIVICAGKNGDDYVIIKELIALLAKINPAHHYFILHMSTVSCGFVSATHEYCTQHNIQYVNYPLTGGAKGAELGKMLILASGDEKLYQRLKPMLEQIGVPEYFGADITRGAAVKLIGHVMLFHNLLGLSLAVNLQKNIWGYNTLNAQQVPFFDFLTQGAGGSRQWDLVVRQGLEDNHWDKGFLVHHALIDVFYAIDLLLAQGLPRTLILPLLEVALLFSYALKKDSGIKATQSIAHFISAESKETIDALVEKYLSFDVKKSLQNCISTLTPELQRAIMLEVKY